MQNFAGQIRCIIGDVQVAYSAFFSLDLQSQKKVVGKDVQLNRNREFSLLPSKYPPSTLFNAGI